MHLDDGPTDRPQTLLGVRPDAPFPATALRLRGLAPPASLASPTVQDHLDVGLIGEGLLKVVVMPLRLARDDEEKATAARR